MSGDFYRSLQRVFARRASDGAPEASSLVGKPSTWRIVPTGKAVEEKLIEEGISLPGAELLELRNVLEDPVGQKSIGLFAKETHTAETFFAWVDIQEYRSIPTADYRRALGIHIYQKYIKENAVLQLGGLLPKEREAIHAALESAKSASSRSGDGAHASTAASPEEDSLVGVFDKVQASLLREMYNNTFVPFKQSAQYKTLRSSMQDAYNKVALDHFDYIARLGEGGFGRVVMVRKRSTGTYLAMKIQLKTGLLEMYGDDLARIDNERRVLSATHHPFIVGLNYAFQTETLAILVLDLVTGGDLDTAICKSSPQRLCELRVQFYVAEIVLALNHLHELGLIYRDLKPCNVLLCDSGHIKLADMGGVAQFVQGTCLDTDNSAGEGAQTRLHNVEIGEAAALSSSGCHDFFGSPMNSPRSMTAPTGLTSPLAAAAAEGAAVGAANGGSDAAKSLPQQSQQQQQQQYRRRSIMGTNGYMAPEMLIQRNQPRRVRKGYGFAVDYWSLGVTVFKLLTGFRPFTRAEIKTFAEDKRCSVDAGFAMYRDLLQSLVFPSWVSAPARSLILGLLNGNELERLGCTPALLAELKEHPFFAGIDWVKLSVRHVIPPFIPPVTPLPAAPAYASFDKLMADYVAPAAGGAAGSPAAAAVAAAAAGGAVQSKPPQWDLSAVPSPEDNAAAFSRWDFVSLRTLKIELGIASEMTALDASFKVRQLLGTKEGTKDGRSGASHHQHSPHSHRHDDTALHGSSGGASSSRASRKLQERASIKDSPSPRTLFGGLRLPSLSGRKTFTAKSW